ncbi:hypothetical protein BH10PSE12_BH10PSE12_07800 [soil metagenome]
MTSFDPRLFELLETLSAARLDWLAFELLEDLQAGQAQVESEQTLAETRRAVASTEQPKARGEPVSAAARAQEISGDAQIRWAAAYVLRRMDAALGQLDVAIDTLDSLIGEGEQSADRGKATPPDGAMLFLSDEDVGRKARREDVVSARAALPSLRQALDIWAAPAGGLAS